MLNPIQTTLTLLQYLYSEVVNLFEANNFSQKFSNPEQYKLFILGGYSGEHCIIDIIEEFSSATSFRRFTRCFSIL